MRKLKNVEIAEYVYKEMEKKEKTYEIDFNKILNMVDDSIEYNNDIAKDENGEILNEMTEEEIKNLKDSMLDGIEEYYDSVNEEL